MVVTVQLARRGVAGHVNIGPAVVVEIGGSRTHRVRSYRPPVLFHEIRRRGTARIGDPGALRDIFEGAVPAIAVQEVCAACQTLRSAWHRNVVEAAVFGFARERYALRVEVHIVGDEQIEMSVPVVVQEATSGAPSVSGSGHTGLCGDIGKRAVAVVVIEHVPAPITYKQVIEAVVVIVSDAAPLAPAGISQASLSGDVGESPVPVISEQVTGGLG